MIKEAIAKVISGYDLTYDESYGVMTEIMTGTTTPTQNAAFLAALSSKNKVSETIDEISGCAAAMRDNSTRADCDLDLVEIVGTGGDNAGSFNISTTSAFVVAASGAKVAKHGNRAASSKCGAADVLEALGANLNLSPAKCQELLDEVGFCFFFAQKYHSSMKYVASIRKELGVRTVFNILGPLTNPARPKRQLLGVYSPELLETLAVALVKLGVKRGMTVYGKDRLDEISTCDSTLVCEFNGEELRSYEIAPEDFGLTRRAKSELLGGDPAENAAITRAVLSGERGAKRDAVLLNAGAALYLGDKTSDLMSGVALAARLIDDGSALAVLNRFVESSRRPARGEEK